MFKDTELFFRVAVYTALAALTGTLGWLVLTVEIKPPVL